MLMQGRHARRIRDRLAQHVSLQPVFWNGACLDVSRPLTSLACNSSSLPIAFPAYMVWGANTDVGKTLFSAGLAAAASRLKVGQLCS